MKVTSTRSSVLARTAAALIGALLTLPCGVAPAWAGEMAAPTEVRLGSSKLGAILLKVPGEWRRDEAGDFASGVVTLVLRPAAGPAFEILITSIHRDNVDWAYLDADELRRRVENVARSMTDQAVEKNPVLVAMDGADGDGFQFSLTDVAPKPDEYKFVTQGMIAVGQSLVTFTILTNDGQTDVARRALDMIEDASWKAGYAQEH